MRAVRPCGGACRIIELANHQLHYHRGGAYRFMAGRQGREAKRASDYALQEKTLKQGLAKGLSRTKAEAKTLA